MSFSCRFAEVVLVQSILRQPFNCFLDACFLLPGCKGPCTCRSNDGMRWGACFLPAPAALDPPATNLTMPVNALPVGHNLCTAKIMPPFCSDYLRVSFCRLSRRCPLEVEISGQHDHVANRHAAGPCQHERHHVRYFAGLQQASRLFGFLQLLRRPVREQCADDRAGRD